MNALPIMHASADIESCRTPSNDERLATWAQRYFLRGHHRNPSKPRIKVTVPQPQQSRAASARKAESPTLSLPAGAAAGTFMAERRGWTRPASGQAAGDWAVRESLLTPETQASHQPVSSPASAANSEGEI